jgi:hypothetical protein
LDHAGFAFHDDKEAKNKPMLSSTTFACCMVKFMKTLEDMSIPNDAVEVIIKWAQAALVDGFDFI